MSNEYERDIAQDLRSLQATLSTLWWKFFDLVAVLAWRKMLLLCGLAFFVAIIFRFPTVVFLAIIATIAMKILAGGKRRADILKGEAIKRADIEALERRLLEAQIAALQAQVEPHFLFNTLALIGQLIETNPPEAAQIHKYLVDYLRSAVPQMRAGGSSTLGSQIESLRAYLAIMRARMKERLGVVIELPPDLAEAPFPPMMLQSLVENAIKHGLEPKTEGGQIRIRAHKVNDYLHVDVADDGVGFAPNASNGIGLTNIRERLKVLYAGQAQLVVEIPPSGGTLVSLRLPYSDNHY